MEFVSLKYFILLFLFLLIVWVPFYRYTPQILTIFGSVFIFITAPLAGIILFSEAFLCYFFVKQSKFTSWKYLLLIVTFVFAAFLLFKFYVKQNSFVLPLGISYYTFRLIHYLQDNYRKIIREHTLFEFLAYMTFFPTYLVGPINLFPEFLSSIRRRVWDRDLFSKGMERVFYGYAVLIIIGNYFVNHVMKSWLDSCNNNLGHFTSLVFQAIHMWTDLYVRFSAYSSIAIGASAMAGFIVPENFNYPFFSTNIREFWQRWHISLTGWCREYIFVPLAAITRRPIIAIGATMIVIGIWHELSIRYVLWGLYHMTGIVVYEKWDSYVIDKLPKSIAFQRFYGIAGTLITVAFVVLSFPVTKILTNYLNNLFL